MGTNDKTVVAFDFGASSGRAIKAVYRDGQIQYEEIHRFDNIPVEKDGHIFHDVDMIMREIHTAIERAGKIDALAFDTWGVDYGLLDESGELLELPFHYRDHRTDDCLSDVYAVMPAGELYQHTGNQIMNINTLFQLFCDKNLPGAKTLLFMPDLFGYLLSGKKVCEKTIASTSQMFDPQAGDWSREVLDAFGINSALLPKICKSGTVTGEYNGIKVISVAGHDTQSAVAAIPNMDADTAFLSCGTWSLFGCELDAPITGKESFESALSNEMGANGKVNYLKNITGLWLIQQIRRDCRQMGMEYSYAQLEKLALESEPFRCFVDPDAPMLFSHGNLLTKVADFCRQTGQSEPKTVGEIVRCVYQSLAMKYRYALEQIEHCTSKRFIRLALIGGGTKDGLLCQMTADSINRPVHAGPIEATALGNIILQLIALGEIKDIEEGRSIIARTEKIKQYIPVQERNQWDEAYSRFLEIMDRQ